MISDVIERMKSRMAYTTARRLMWLAGVLPSKGWQGTIEKYDGQERPTEAGRLRDLLIEHALYSEKHVKLHGAGPKIRSAIQNKLLNFELPESDEMLAYPLPLDQDSLAKSNGMLKPVAVEQTSDGVGLVVAQTVLQKTREVIRAEDLGESRALVRQYDELVGVKLQPVPLFHVLWVPHERNYVEFRLDCTLGTGTRNAFEMHSLLRRFCADLLEVRFEPAVDLFPAVVSLYGDTRVGRATEISFSTPTNGLHNEKLLRREDGDTRLQAYHLAGRSALDDDISVYQIVVEWTSQISQEKTYATSLALRGSGPSGNGPGGNPEIKAAMLEGCLNSEDFEHLIEVLAVHASLEG